MPGPTTYFDPARLDAVDARTRALVERRTRVLGPAYRLFYEHPLELVRGQGTRVWDADGVEYLDAYNNVPSVGHAHPRVVAAMAEQSALLTTHTRYLAEPTIAYAERLLATFPAHLDTMMFTCTGSEANDLALRVARWATGGTGILVTANAYHGVTTDVAAISPSLGGPESLGPDVVTVDPEDLAGGAAAGLAEFARRGIHPAALIVDTVLASDGVWPDLPGIADAVAAVRAAGGLFIADEVQPGFGRLGDGMWGFDRHGLAPDIVTLGKPMGNGYPVAAMIARRELVDEFNRHSRYFNTFGGSSVAIAAARATLDVIEEEGLIAHAREVGAGLRDDLAATGLFVDVRGAGLFVGAQLESEARAVAAVNAAREKRVLLSASGPNNDTLKIRPPLPFSAGDSAWLVEVLTEVL